ncbi:unnamed protein product [Symbiodinium pilosum]|uniref:Uncharacterized protein n=1 Tax=Symbiodinium pilosum TaxID=2952 RepID=A0A812LYM2_SYMPI|nr:unnamed protein product [Symbiodinium pilosum]
MYGSTNITTGTMYDWMKCFSSIKSMSAMLNPEQDVYDSNGYTTNKHWVSGPNTVFKSIMDAMYTGTYKGMYDAFFLMEMDAVPLKHYWLEQFETEAHEMPDMNIAVRGSQYLGDKWDLFKHQMPNYLVEHINGNAIYNLNHNWTSYLYTTFTSDSAMMEEMAFDVGFAMITMAAMDGDAKFASGWTSAMGGNMTYNAVSSLVGNYANTLLNKSFEFPTFIRHGSSKNLFSALEDDVTLGVAFFDKRGHLKETVPTHHPFKKILGLAYYDEMDSLETIMGPNGNISMNMTKAQEAPYYHLCEVAKMVDTTWFALTDNYHIVKAPVSVLMEGDKPVLPYVLKDSKYCGERPNCKASLEQAEDLFSINLNYHHDKYEVLYKTADAIQFCKAWDTAVDGKSWSDCSLTFGPTGDDYIAWKISSPASNITDEFMPKDKTRYGWRAWTSLWQPAPVESRTCDTILYGVKEYLETLENISECAVNYVEDAAGCAADSTCSWRPMFESGICMLDYKSVVPQTTVEGAVYSTVEVKMPIVVDDPATITENTTITTAMRSGFADLMGVDLDRVKLTFEEQARRLQMQRRRLSVTLLAVYEITMDTIEAAEELRVAVETTPIAETQRVIKNTVAQAGFQGSFEVRSVQTALVPSASTTTTTTTMSATTTTGAGDDDETTTTTTEDGDGEEEPPSSAVAGTVSAAVLGLATMLLA